jgi:hypothetical protein
MNKKQLKNYLEKAEYLRVLIKGTTKSPLSPAPSSHKISKSIRCLNSLRAIPYRTHDSRKLGALLKSSVLVEISLAEIVPTDDNNSLKVAGIANAIGNRQNLHLLYYRMIYYASKKKAIFKWRRPQKFNAPLKLQKMLPSLKRFSSKTFIAKFSKITSEESDSLQEGKETMEINQLAREREYSERRNYRTSTHLYT